MTFVVSQSESNFPDRKGNGEESREEMITVSQKNHTERSTCRRRRHLYLYIASGFTFYIITENSNRKRKSLSLSLSLKRRKKRENSSPVFYCVKWRVYQLYIKCFKCAKEKKKKKDTHLRASMTPRESGVVAEEESCEVLSEFLIVDQR